MGATDHTKQAMVVIISSPSGGGKTTIVSKVLEQIDGATRSISYTTRPPRKNEKDEEDYCFVTEEEFKKGIEADDFLEWAKNFDCYYGTSAKQVREKMDKGLDVILSIDVKGAREVREKIPECISLFILPPSVEELKKRLEQRETEGEEQLLKRVREAEIEIAASDEYDYLVVNDDLEKAVLEVKEIIEKERKDSHK